MGEVVDGDDREDEGEEAEEINAMGTTLLLPRPHWIVSR
jgi:hypothetical protein